MDGTKPVNDPLVDSYLEAKPTREMTADEFERWFTRGSLVDALDDAARMAVESGVALGELVACLQRRYRARCGLGWLAQPPRPSRPLPPAA